MRVLVPRPAADADAWLDALRAHGLHGVSMPLLRIVPLVESVGVPADADWLIVTSRGTVPLLDADAVREAQRAGGASGASRSGGAASAAGATGAAAAGARGAVAASGYVDAGRAGHAAGSTTEAADTSNADSAVGARAGLRVAAVGHGTAAGLGERGIRVDFAPADQSAAGLVAAWPGGPGERVFAPQSARAKPTLAAGLRALGLEVETCAVYRPESAFADAQAFAEAWVSAAGSARPDAVLVTSGTVAEQVARLGLGTCALVAIGGPTAGDCESLGLSVAAVATEPAPESMAAAAAPLAR